MVAAVSWWLALSHMKAGELAYMWGLLLAVREFTGWWHLVWPEPA